jgi:hypothetical protein
MTKWRKSTDVPVMVANTFTYGASVGTTGLATRVECAAKQLVNEVKVSGLMLCWGIYTMICSLCGMFDFRRTP